MSTVNAKINSINCTQCAAPLELHGGRQVKSISCPYCGSVLDNKNEYKVVEQFLSIDRPYTPLFIGQEGILNGVKLTVIGYIKYQTADGGGWIEYQLFSPTHGYSWLSYEKGHFVFGHKVRYYPESYSKDRQSNFQVNGINYQVIDEYSAKIVYVEGELTWVAHKNDKVQTLEAIAPPYIYYIENTANEEEYSIGEYLSTETVFKAFDIKGKQPKTYWIHPAQPYTQGTFFAALTSSSKLFAKIYLLICILLFVFVNPKSVLYSRVNVDQYKQGFVSQPFKVDDPDRALKLNMTSNLSNSWAFFTLDFKRNNIKNVYHIGKEMYYYHKGSEQQGSQQASLYFKVPSAGNYTMTVKGIGGEQLQPLEIEIQSGVRNTRNFWRLLGLTVFFGWIWPFFGRWRFNSKRWSDSE